MNTKLAEKGLVFQQPALVFDSKDYIVLKIGELDDVKGYYNMIRKAFSMVDYKALNLFSEVSGLPTVTIPIERQIKLLELPNNCELINNILGNSGYLEKYLKEEELKNVTKINFDPIL